MLFLLLSVCLHVCTRIIVEQNRRAQTPLQCVVEEETAFCWCANDDDGMKGGSVAAKIRADTVRWRLSNIVIDS